MTTTAQATKTFRDFVIEAAAATAIAAEDIPAAAREAEDYLNKELKKMFPGRKVIVRYSDNIGRSLRVAVYAVPEGANDLDTSNAKGKLVVRLWLSGRGGQDIAMNKFSFEMQQSAYQVKDGKEFVKIPYRKITGKTPMDAAKKLVKKFGQHRDAFELNPDVTPTKGPRVGQGSGFVGQGR